MHFADKLSLEIGYIEERLSMLKTIPFLYNFRDPHKTALIEYLTPGLYSIWERFFVLAIEKYIHEVNSLNLDLYKINEKILSLDLIDFTNINAEKDSLTNNGQIMKYRDNIIEYFAQKSKTIQIKIETGSNVNSLIMNKMLRKLDIEELRNSNLHDDLDNLLKFRNAIAHGNAILVGPDDFNKMAKTVSDAVYELSFVLIDAYESKKYLKSAYR